MATPRINAFAKLKYGNPRGYLIQLAKLEQEIAASNLDKKVRTLRTNELKIHRERRQAALFCYFMADRLQTEILFSPVESQDYDFVARWERDKTLRFAPTQLKEVVPEDLNPTASVERIIASLANKYPNSPDLSVVIHLNKRSDFNPLVLDIPKLPLGSLWIFWATAPGGRQWALCGDYLDNPSCSRHEYPAA